MRSISAPAPAPAPSTMASSRCVGECVIRLLGYPIADFYTVARDYGSGSATTAVPAT